MKIKTKLKIATSLLGILAISIGIFINAQKRLTADVNQPGVSAPEAGSTSDLAFVESNGEVVMEAERYAQNNKNSDASNFILKTDYAGYSGEGYMQSPNNKKYGGTDGPELVFNVSFNTPGKYYVWTRAWVPGTGGEDSCFVGIDDVIPSSGKYVDFSNLSNYSWTSNNRYRYLNVASSGLSTIHLWQREGNFRPDKLILTTDSNYTPSDTGPAESSTMPLSQANRKPSASVSAKPNFGQTPLLVKFSGLGTDTDGTIASYSWDLGDGTTSSEQNPSHTYVRTASSYRQVFIATLTVTDNKGATAKASIQIIVQSASAEYYKTTYGLIQSAGLHFYPIPDEVTKGKLEYRKKGDTLWKEAMPPVITYANGRLEAGCSQGDCLDAVETDIEPMIKRFVGGATSLKPDTTYELNATLLRADNSVYDTVSEEVKTKPDTVTYGNGRTINVKLDGTGDYTSIRSAISAAVAGDTIVVHPGTYVQTFPINKSGEAGNPITIRGLPGAILRTTSANAIIIFPENLHDVILEGFTLVCEAADTSTWAYIRLYNNLTRVVIQNNIFHDVQFYDTAGSTDLIVQNNRLESDRYIMYPFYFVANPPYKIRGLIVRNNTVKAPGDSFDVADFRGYKEFVDIYNNWIEGVHGGDGIELEGGVHLFVLFHHNICKLREHSSAHGGKGRVATISNTPIIVGPTYIFRNEFDSSDQYIKTANNGTGNEINNGHTLADFGPIFYFNNSFYAAPEYWTQNFIRFRTLSHANFIFKNNIFYGKIHDAETLVSAFTYPRSDVRWGQYDPDYNVYFNNRTTTNPYTSYGVDLHSVFADPLFAGSNGSDLHLKKDSPAIDKGINISNVTDSFNGEAPDIGAYEFADNKTPVPSVTGTKTIPIPKVTSTPEVTPTPEVTSTTTQVALIPGITSTTTPKQSTSETEQTASSPSPQTDSTAPEDNGIEDETIESATADETTEVSKDSTFERVGKSVASEASKLASSVPLIGKVGKSVASEASKIATSVPLVERVGKSVAAEVVAGAIAFTLFLIQAIGAKTTKTIKWIGIVALFVGTLLVAMMVVYKHTWIDWSILGLYALLWPLEIYFSFSKLAI